MDAAVDLLRTVHIEAVWHLTRNKTGDFNIFNFKNCLAMYGNLMLLLHNVTLMKLLNVVA